MVAELLQKYIWLIQTFIKSADRGLTLEELGRKWENRFGESYARRTFNNHREAIEDIFNIKIDCNRSSHRYYIRYSSDVTDGDSASAWLINTFTVNSLLSLGKERLTGRVSVEDIPSGHKYLTAIMDAMLEGNELKVKYRKYTSEESSEYTLRPYAIKEDTKRWYLIAYCVERESIRVYGLDRISELATTGETFTMPQGFDVDELFSTSFGVYLSKEPPCEIIFKASHKEAGYLRDLPLHQTQKELSDDEDGVTFSIFASPNSSLIMELLRLGSRIEVFSPDSIREQVISEVRKMDEIYAKQKI